MGARQSTIAPAAAPAPVVLPDHWLILPHMSAIDRMPERAWVLPRAHPASIRPKYGMQIASQATPYPHDPEYPESLVEVPRYNEGAWRRAWATGRNRQPRGVPPAALYSAPDDDTVGLAATRLRGFTRALRPGPSNNWQSVSLKSGDIMPEAGLEPEPPRVLLAGY